MNVQTRRGGFAALMSGFGRALQWRMLLWWLLALWLPTLLVAAPLWSGLQAQWGQSPHAAAIAAARELPLLADAFAGIDKEMNVISIAALFATALTLLLSPWLAGMVVASIRAGRKLGMGELLQGGVREYGRMFRTLLWSILPLGLAIGIGAVAIKMAGKQADTAILASQAETADRIGLAVLAVLFVFAHMTVEAGRGWFGADAGLRSAIRAWWRGTKLVLRRPLAALVVYLGTSLIAYVLAALFGIWRLNTSGAGFGGFLLGLLLAQLVFLALAWGRIARLYGFADLAGTAAARSATAVPIANTDDHLSIQPSETASA